MAEASLFLPQLVDEAISPKKIWAADYLNRKVLAQRYTTLLNSMKHSFVIAISGPFGSGKTFFLKRWAEQLEKEDYITLFYNSWETDFSDNTFYPFMVEILSQALEKGLLSKDDQLYERFSSVVKKICEKAFYKLLEFKTLGLVSESDTKEVIDRAASRRDLSLPEWDQRLKDDLVELRQVLEDLSIKGREHNKKIVIFIDELERCRPDKAIELLEYTKHIFEGSGIIFVLGTDHKQLVHTVKQMYGQGMDLMAI